MADFLNASRSQFQKKVRIIAWKRGAYISYGGTIRDCPYELHRNKYDSFPFRLLVARHYWNRYIAVVYFGLVRHHCLYLLEGVAKESTQIRGSQSRKR